MKKIVRYLLIISIIVFIIFFPRVIKVKKYNCESQTGACPQNIEEKIKEVRGKNLNDAKKLVSSQLKKDPSVLKFSIRYQIPDKLKVFVITEKPIITIKKQSSNSYWLIDKNGRVIEEAKETNLPIIFAESEIELRPGDSVSREQKFAIEIIDLANFVFSTNTAKLFSTYVELDMGDNIKAVLPLEGDKEVLIGSLKIILYRLKTDKEAFRIEGQGLKSSKLIDLRYKNPVIKSL